MTLPTAQRKALEWFVKHGPAHLFSGRDGCPNLTMVRKLRDLGYVQEAGLEPGPGIFRLTRYAISDAGREAISK